jgi:hypothetical protein
MTVENATTQHGFGKTGGSGALNSFVVNQV